MEKKLLLLFGNFLIIFIFSVSFSVASEPAKEIVAIGVADGKSSMARDEALNDALRKAVEQGVGTAVTTELTVDQQRLVEDRIYTESRGYVRQYKVLSETAKGDLYEVKISAVVKMDELAEDLKSIGLLIRKKQNPRFIIVIYSTEIDSSFMGIALEGNRNTENQVEGLLKKKGFQVIDAGQMRRKKELEAMLLSGDRSRAGLMARDFGADVLIQGEVTRTFAGIREIYGRATRFFSNDLRIKALETDTGKILFSGYRSRPASAADALFFLEEATAELLDEMLAGIFEQWRHDVFQAGSYHLNLSKISFKGLSRLKEDLRKIRGIVDIRLRSFQSGHAILEVEYKGPLGELAEKIGGLREPPLEITGMQANTIDIQFPN